MIMSDWDFDIFGGSGSDYVPTSSDFSSGQDLSPYFAGPEYGDGGDWSYGGDAVGPSYYGEPQVQQFSIGPGQSAANAHYGVEQIAQPPQQSGGIWNTLQSIGGAMESPGGKLATGLFGAGISAYGANKANKNAKDAYKKQQALLAQRRAQAMRFNEKANVGALRQAVAPGAVQQRGGESVFFNDNRLPVYAAEGGSISEEDWLRMQEENNQGILEARMDKPSAMGFLRYLYNGKRMPSEIAAAARAARPDVISNRREALREAANYGEQPTIQRAAGGPTNYVRGGTPGQADQIPARLSDGEYVMDADVVSALGDGNNEAGAAKLDQMREGIRAHKRSAPASKIPPKAKSPLAYMKKGTK